MTSPQIDRIANAVLYEGYLLYPYRPSTKNRQRWTFGGLYPEAFCQAQTGADASFNQTECVLRGSRDTRLDVTARFLQLTERTAGGIAAPLGKWTDDPEPAIRPVEALQIGEQSYRSWQEAEERQIELIDLTIGQLLETPQHREFHLPARRWVEPIAGPTGKIEGVLVREQQSIAGVVMVRAAEVGDNTFKITVQLANRTPFDILAERSRDEALLRTLVSSHTVLQLHGGAFVSLMDPPEDGREAVAGCKNVGVWPVLVGEVGSRDALLASPIILYDYPQIAVESPGDLFDGTEIDEILTLRILTLTEAEKREAASLDDRSRHLLARTEALAREQLSGLHGAMRSPTPTEGRR